MQKNLLLLVLLLLAQCSRDEDVMPKNFSYIIINKSAVDVGIRINRKPNADGYELIKSDTFKLKAGEEIEFLKAEQQLDVQDFVSSIVIVDPMFKVVYKYQDLTQKTIDGNICKIFLWLPNPKTKEIVNIFGRPVPFEIDEDFISGFYQGGKNQTIYFRTKDDFQNIEKSVLQVEYGETIFRSGNTIIVADTYGYSTLTKFLISKDNGNSWTNLISISNEFSEDFLTTDFINSDQGWFFKYRNWKFTDVYKTEGLTYTKISSISGYCIKQAKFTNAMNGYVLANVSDNVSPSSGPGSYFLKTIDGGLTWLSPKLIDADSSPTDLFVFPSGRIMAIVFSNSLFKRMCYVSEDGGATWNLQVLQIDGFIQDVQFVNGSLGFLKVHSHGIDYLGHVYKTIDEGKTWTKISGPMVSGVYIKFYNELIGYSQYTTYKDGQFLYVTRDGGLSWKEVVYPYPYLK